VGEFGTILCMAASRCLSESRLIDKSFITTPCAFVYIYVCVFFFQVSNNKVYTLK
jgi:hypothetical protein